MKFLKRFFLVFGASLLFGTTVFAQNFYIKDYNVDIDVNKNKQAHIVETIDTYFTNKSHGLIRKIPYEKASITGINVDDERYSVSKTNDEVSVKIGDADKYVEGDKRYIIKYDYNYHDNKDEFYHNIIGTKWDVPINHVKFKITLPDKINPDEAGLSIGRYGTKGFDGGAVFTINGNVVTGETERVLQPKEGITFRTPVEKGYFNTYYNWRSIGSILFIIILTLISYFTWLKIGKDDIIVPVVNFELPKNIKNALEADVYFNDKPTNEGIVALILELANKGYLKIENDDKYFAFHKLKNADNLDEYEKQLLDSIFKGKDVVTKDDLYNSSEFYSACTNIKCSKLDIDIYDKVSIDPIKTRFMYRCTILILSCLLAFGSGFNIAPFFNFEAMIGYGTLILAALFFVKEGWLNENKAWVAPWGVAGLMFFLLAALGYTTSEYVWQIVFAAVCGVITTICAINLPKVSKTALQIKGQLEGLKKYIEVAEKHQIEKMLKDNPQQFFNILPYAYILGVTDIWLDKFSTIFETNPQMFESTNYNVRYFSNLVSSMSYATTPSYANGGMGSYSHNDSSSSSSHSYRSSSGGGGFSGGGGGGGGGSSW